jgi:hypothetical protein
MAKIDSHPGMPYRNPEETWEPTMHLAFFAIYDDPIDSTRAVRKLHQLWRSNIGRQMWRPVVEMDPNSRDNE